MHKVIEADYCDCCGKRLSDAVKGDYMSNDIPKKAIILPKLTEEETSYDFTRYKVIEINDICDECMTKLIEFTKALITTKDSEE